MMDFTAGVFFSGSVGQQKMNWQAKLNAICSEVKYDEPLSKHTSFQIGGAALAFVEVDSVAELKALVAFRERFNLPVRVIGNGTNVLFSDAGYQGIIAILGSELSQVRFEGTSVTAYTGITLGKLIKQCTQRRLGGLEFTSGIPGTLGGALIMNAGAYGHSLSEVVTDILVMKHDGELLTIPSEQAGFTYRDSNLKQYFCLIEATLRLKPAAVEEIEIQINRIKNTREGKLPSSPSAGCVFKNLPGMPAGKLIDECGLKGLRIGNAEVSEKHANFIVNTGGATAADVLDLIDKVKRCVKTQRGIDLKLEVKLID